MTTIDTEQLLDGIQNSLHLAPYEISQSMIDRYIDKIRSQNIKVSTDAPETLAMTELVKNYFHHFTPERTNALSGCEIYVVPFPLCIAYSQPKGDRKIIVVGNGLLNLICNCAYWAHFIASIPGDFDKIFPFDETPTLSVKSALSVFSFILIYRYYRYGEALPDFRRLLDKKAHNTVAHNITGAIAFILFHELGHLELDHLHDSETRPMNVNLVVEQELSVYQQQEFEADAFAFSSAKSDNKKLCLSWINTALTFFSQTESMLSHREANHPVTLNRLYQAHTQTDNTLNSRNDSKMETHLKGQGESFKNIESYNQQIKNSQQSPFLSSISRDQTIETLMKLNTHLKAADIDIAPIFENVAPDWHTI